MKAFVAQLLDRARVALRLSKPDVREETKDTEETVTALLDDYADRLEESFRPGAPGVWIFKSNVPHELYRTAVLALIHDARKEGQREGAAEMAERANWTCACRCIAHVQRGCPKCLNVWGCPVHNEVDPASLNPELLTDPVRVTDAIDAEAFLLRNNRTSREAYVEAVRRVVCARVEQKLAAFEERRP